MKRTCKYLFCFFSLVLLSRANAQNISTPNYGDKDFYLVDSLDLNLLNEEDLAFVDSCLRLYHKESNDTTKLKAILGIVDNIWNQNVWPVYNRYLLHRLLNSSSSVVGAAETRFMKTNLASCINNEGFYYRSIGNIPLALHYYHKSLKLLEELHDTLNITWLYNNIGSIYQHQHTFDRALEYHFKAIELKKLVGDSAGLANSYNNIGVIYELQDSLDKASFYFQKGLDLYLKYNDIRGYSRAYYNLAFNYFKNDSFQLAEDYFRKSLLGYEKIGEREGLSLTCSGLGSLNLKLGNISVAKKYLDQGLEIALELGHPSLIMHNATVLSEVAVKSGNWKAAFEMRNLEIQMRDSIENLDNIKMTADADAKYEYDKQEVINNLQHKAEIEKQQSISEAEQKRQTTILVSVSIGLGLVVLFTVFLINRFRVTQKQKKIIEAQKHEVEEKNKEILDSIRYAKRIQNAILPSMDAMKAALKKGFVFYKPKDVVAGDFYWMEELNDKVYFAAADCTGHGVPGAMVSVVCSNALSKALLEENAKSTGELLDKTREIVINQLAKSGEEMRDGMDISLSAIDFLKMEMEWTGANNPIWIVRGNELIEFKPDKQPVGVHSQMKPFSTKIIPLESGDKIYLMTDGFQDQFGGEHGKKFKAAKLKEKIIALRNVPMDDQSKLLDTEFENWRRNLEQIDDVCIIGVAID